MGFKVERQVPVKIEYYGVFLDEGFRMDILIDGSVVVELKAAEVHHPVWEAQVISYLRLSKNNLGFLINFNVPLVKQGIKRFVNFKKLEEESKKK